MQITPIRLVLCVPFPPVELCIIRNTIPQKLSTTPPAFSHVIGSFMANAATNIVYIGLNALKMEQVMGVTSGIAIRKDACTRKKPINEAAKSFG